MNDYISKQAAIEALGEEPEVWGENNEYEQGLNNQWHYDVNALKVLPSADVIPIEWLKKKAQEFAERYWSKQDDHKKLILPMKDCPIVIEQMIKEWGKENG